MRQLGRRTGLATLKDAQVFGYRRFDLDQRYLALAWWRWAQRCVMNVFSTPVDHSNSSRARRTQGDGHLAAASRLQPSEACAAPKWDPASKVCLRPRPLNARRKSD
jgi:hypothetical protein